MTAREKYINAITNQAVRRQVYAEAHAGLSKNQCAFTQYLFLVAAKVLKDRPWRPKGADFLDTRYRPTFTSQLEHILLTEVKGVKRITDPAKLQRGDICFSQNRNSTPGPDHVYAMHTPQGQGTRALVVDNYAIGPHQRNITATGPRTPFDYALRLP